MKERPILFSTPMVQAILAGNKTMTRRIIKPQPYFDKDSGYWYWKPTKKGAIMANRPPCDWFAFYPPKYGMIEDRLWVRETFGWYNTIVAGSYGFVDGEEVKYPPHVIKNGFKRPIVYKADYPKHRFDPNDSGWKPSIHMPRIASRITLEITDVRVERLQDITKEDAYREGVEIVTTKPCTQYKDYEVNDGIFCNPRNSFNSLWNVIHGKDSWNLNPWVWVISFRKEATHEQ